MNYKFFDKKSSGGAATLANKSPVKNENMSNKELAEELHKPIISTVQGCSTQMSMSIKTL